MDTLLLLSYDGPRLMIPPPVRDERTRLIQILEDHFPELAVEQLRILVNCLSCVAWSEETMVELEKQAE